MKDDKVVIMPWVLRIVEEQEEIAPNTILENAKKYNFKTVLVVGYDEFGERHIFSSEGNYYASVGKLFAAAQWLANGKPVE